MESEINDQLNDMQFLDGVILFSNNLMEITGSYSCNDREILSLIEKLKKTINDKTKLIKEGSENDIVNKWIHFLSFLQRVNSKDLDNIKWIKDILSARHYPPKLILFTMTKSLLTAYINDQAHKLLTANRLKASEENEWKEKAFGVAQLDKIECTIQDLEKKKEQSHSEPLIKTELKESSESSFHLVPQKTSQEKADSNNEWREELRQEIALLKKSLMEREIDTNLLKEKLLEEKNKREIETNLLKEMFWEVNKSLLEERNQRNLLEKRLENLEQYSALLYLINLRKGIRKLSKYTKYFPDKIETSKFKKVLESKHFNLMEFYSNLCAAIENISKSVTTDKPKSLSSWIDMEQVEQMEKYLIQYSDLSTESSFSI